MLLQPSGGVVHLLTVSAFYEKIKLCIDIYRK
ncbi:hypothetical protein EADG_01055 [Escherichia coli E1114]|nr:hypothetical protein EADG_01055 [Escherichia coli E1114]OSL92498.1 hypothetical protein EBBG_01662 [Escherichia coli E704]